MSSIYRTIPPLPKTKNTATQFILNDQIDGINEVFILPQEVQQDSLLLLSLNGQILNRPEDFELISETEVRMYFAPPAGNQLVAIVI